MSQIGFDPFTAAVRHVLAAQGICAPHTNQPYSEALLLGIGGGLGAGYILWEFKRHDSALIVLGFRNRWNYNVDYLTNLCQRLGAPAQIHEAGGRKAAQASFDNALAAGAPFIAWVDKAHLPYWQLPEALKAYISYAVAVTGLDDDAVLVQDVAPVTFRVPLAEFTAGRERIVSDKARILRIQPPRAHDPAAAALAGIADCLEHLGRASESFSLPVYKKWAKMMTDSKNKKGWPVVFGSRGGLYSTLRSIYEGIRLDGTDGAGLRRLYADFLDEAAPLTDKPGLTAAADAYRRAADAWVALADAALPGDAFAETRTLLTQRYAHIASGELTAARPLSDRLDALPARMNAAFPLEAAAVTALFESLAERLGAIYDAETAALNTLRQAIA